MELAMIILGIEATISYCITYKITYYNRWYFHPTDFQSILMKLYNPAGTLTGWHLLKYISINYHKKYYQLFSFSWLHNRLTALYFNFWMLQKKIKKFKRNTKPEEATKFRKKT